MHLSSKTIGIRGDIGGQQAWVKRPKNNPKKMPTVYNKTTKILVLLFWAGNKFS